MLYYEARRNGKSWGVFNLRDDEFEEGFEEYGDRESAEEAADQLNDADDVLTEYLLGEERPTARGELCGLCMIERC